MKTKLLKQQKLKILRRIAKYSFTNLKFREGISNTAKEIHYKIEVTQEDIDKGIPGQMRSCPIALALARQTKLTWRVNTNRALPYYPGKITDAKPLPVNAIEFIARFDNRKLVIPFSFDFDWITPT